jgi:hypothetical protein
MALGNGTAVEVLVMLVRNVPGQELAVGSGEWESMILKKQGLAITIGS